LLAINAGACFDPDDGREPPLDRIYFPTGLALSPDGNRLYLANSDWDLQFNAGSVQVYDTGRLRELLPRHCDSDADCEASSERCDLAPAADPNGAQLAGSHWCVDAQTLDPCRGLGLQSAAERLVAPGLCSAFESRDPELLLGSVRIGAFATDLVYRENPTGGGRLFAPVRSDATLHWIDVRGGTVAGGPERELECGQGASGECDANHRRGDGATESTAEGDGLPIEPFGLDATLDGTAVVVTHQTEGKVSLFVNDWQRSGAGPELAFVLENLPALPLHVSSIPIPEVARLERASDAPRQLGYQPGFWLAFRGTSPFFNPFIQLIRYFDSVDASDGRPFLERAFADRITTTASIDIRGMAVDASTRTACEVACAPGDLPCLSACAGIALDVYLANAPPFSGSLLIGKSTSVRRNEISNDRLRVSDMVAVDEGPSRTVIGYITDEQGQLRRRVFVASFDSRSVTIYDPEARVVEARVATGRGPTALAIDGANALAYVAHFTDSYVGVIDLDRRHDTFGTIIRALGQPSAPRGDP
jgi:DNA-binding beta-propeller fold protein YncE